VPADKLARPKAGHRAVAKSCAKELATRLELRDTACGPGKPHADRQRSLACWRQDPEQMRKVLRAALTEDPPPSLPEVANRLDYRTCVPLRRLDAENHEVFLMLYWGYRSPYL